MKYIVYITPTGAIANYKKTHLADASDMSLCGATNSSKKHWVISTTPGNKTCQACLKIAEASGGSNRASSPAIRARYEEFTDLWFDIIWEIGEPYPDEEKIERLTNEAGKKFTEFIDAGGIPAGRYYGDTKKRHSNDNGPGWKDRFNPYPSL